MRVSNLLGTLGKCKHDEFMKLMSETLDQAKHDDVCMRQLAHLLKLDSTQVVLAVSQLLLKGSSVGEMSSANAQTADFRDAMRQVQSGVAQPRTKLSDFDPIAAAEGSQVTLGGTVENPLKETEAFSTPHLMKNSQHPGYDISAYYAQAMARKEQISEFYKSDDMPLNSIIVALPKSFSRVSTDLEPEPTVKFVVYNHLADMADQLNKIPISSAMDSMLESSTITDLLLSVPKFHPALSLGVSPRNGEDRLHGWQVMVFLEQLRDAASNTLRLLKFTLKPRKPKDDKDKDAKRPHSNDDAEPTAKKKKLPKRPDGEHMPSTVDIGEFVLSIGLFGCL
ncbi:unnamed protein product [Heligmosomoides polygyrus]|uniref:PCI domain-containing protein n=1 Tax=Heligmosomoides polygyrus TaxID=6339 RepID=A0A183FKM9_HELPZ|nr:unnamed protein product [Heligmosomoides polygyrus]